MSYDMKDMVEFQRTFDKRHGWLWDKAETDEEFIERIQEATLALVGEVGEFANIVKKIKREHGSLGTLNREHMPSLREELVDVFIYLLILSIALGMDLPKEYYDKMKKNEERFRKFEVKKNN